MLEQADHPAYDLAMELLCLLPPAPIGVPVVLLAEDLGLGRQIQIYRLADKLKKQGIRLVDYRGKGPNTLSVAKRSWGLAAELAESYLDVVGG